MLCPELPKYIALLSNVYFPKLHLDDTQAQQQSTFFYIWRTSFKKKKKNTRKQHPLSKIPINL